MARQATLLAAAQRAAGQTASPADALAAITAEAQERLDKMQSHWSNSPA
jgi:uncharacterized protein YukE